jgi:hypothetical protein
MDQHITSWEMMFAILITFQQPFAMTTIQNEFQKNLSIFRNLVHDWYHIILAHHSVMQKH